MSARNSTKAEVRNVLGAWVDAIRAKDVSAVLRHHAAEFEQFALAPPLRAATDQKEDLEGWFSSFDGPIRYEIREQTITAGDGVAFCSSLNRVSGTTRTGERIGMWFRQTMGLRKSNGAWKIVHEHESVPFYMEGDARAATDLEP